MEEGRWERHKKILEQSPCLTSHWQSFNEHCVLSGFFRTGILKAMACIQDTRINSCASC